MSTKFLNNVDLTGNQLLNFVVQVLAADPDPPAQGQMWFNSTSNRLRYFDGTTVHTLASASGGTLTGILGTPPIVATDNEDGTYTISINAATTSLPGSMSAADKTKLDGIDAGAQVNPTASAILASLLTVDGAGSGLDADLLDGQHGSHYLDRTNHTGTQAISTVSGLQSALDDKVDDSLLGANNGVATLDGSGKLTTSQIPDAMLGGLDYLGTWDADENDPVLSDGSGTASGQFYKVSVEGTAELDGIDEWHVGDWVIFDGTAWQKIDNTDAVTSVNTQTGAVVITASGLGALVAASNLSDLANAATARDNLGLGDSAVLDVGTTAGTVAAGDDSRLNRRYSANVGNNSSTQIDITHGLGTRDVIVQVREAGSPYAVVIPDIEALDTNTVRLRFAVAPDTDEYRVTVLA